VQPSFPEQPELPPASPESSQTEPADGDFQYKTIWVTKTRKVMKPVPRKPKKGEAWRGIPESPMSELRKQAVKGHEQAKLNLARFEEQCKYADTPPPNQLATSRKLLENVDIALDRIKSLDDQVNKCLSMKLLQFPPQAVASQLSLICYDLIQGIQLKEIQTLAEEKPEKVPSPLLSSPLFTSPSNSYARNGKKKLFLFFFFCFCFFVFFVALSKLRKVAPHAFCLIQMARYMSFVVAHEILSCPEAKDRASTIIHFIKVPTSTKLKGITSKSLKRQNPKKQHKNTKQKDFSILDCC